MNNRKIFLKKTLKISGSKKNHLNSRLPRILPDGNVLFGSNIDIWILPFTSLVELTLDSSSLIVETKRSGSGASFDMYNPNINVQGLKWSNKF